jgi:hypothetical protein
MINKKLLEWVAIPRGEKRIRRLTHMLHIDNLLIGTDGARTHIATVPELSPVPTLMNKGNFEETLSYSGELDLVFKIMDSMKGVSPTVTIDPKYFLHVLDPATYNNNNDVWLEIISNKVLLYTITMFCGLEFGVSNPDNLPDNRCGFERAFLHDAFKGFKKESRKFHLFEVPGCTVETLRGVYIEIGTDKSVVVFGKTILDIRIPS